MRLLGRFGWSTVESPLSQSVSSPRGAIIVASNSGVVVASKPGSGKPPTVQGVPEPGMCHVGRYIPCGDDGVSVIQDWWGRGFTLVIRNIGRLKYDPVRDGLDSGYYCHYEHVALIIPILPLPNAKPRRVDKLPWRRACQVSVRDLHNAFKVIGIGVVLQ
jgi:hypothetical protein